MHIYIYNYMLILPLQLDSLDITENGLTSTMLQEPKLGGAQGLSPSL